MTRDGGRGQTFSYIKAQAVIERLNYATRNAWDFSVDRYWYEGDLVLAIVTLSIPGLGSRSHIGVQSNKNNVGEDALAKGAVSDALKKAAAMFGVGAELYTDTGGGNANARGGNRSGNNYSQQQQRQPNPDGYGGGGQTRQQQPARQEAAQQQQRPAGPGNSTAQSGGNGQYACAVCRVALTAGQSTFSLNKYKRPLCPDHQVEAGRAATRP